MFFVAVRKARCQIVPLRARLLSPTQRTVSPRSVYFYQHAQWYIDDKDSNNSNSSHYSIQKDRIDFITIALYHQKTENIM